MRYYQKLLIICLLLILSSGAFAQINTESMRRTRGEKGFGVELSFGLNYASGNSDYLTLNPGLRLELQGDTYHAFFISSFTRGEASHKLYQKNAFGHLRFVHYFTDNFALEAFAQKEFNDFIALDDRNLVGGGMRLKFLQTKTFEWFLGVAAMVENEHSTDPFDGEKTLLRSTNYLASTWKLDDRVDFSLAGYYQVDVNSTSDYRILLQSSLDFALTKVFSVRTSFNLRYDNEPVASVEKQDVAITNGVIFSF